MTLCTDTKSQISDFFALGPFAKSSHQNYLQIHQFARKFGFARTLFLSGLILLIHCISFTTAQRSWCADRDALKLKWLASVLWHALFPVYWSEWARVRIFDTRNSLPTRIFDYFWYQKFAQWLTEESLVSWDEDVRMVRKIPLTTSLKQRYLFYY